MTFSNREVAEDYLRRLLEERGPMPEWWYPGKVQEEAGEAWRAFIRLAGFHRRLGTVHAYAEELADTVISAYAAALMKDINLDEAIQRKHAILMSRAMREEMEEDEGPEGKWADRRKPLADAIAEEMSVQMAADSSGWDENIAEAFAGVGILPNPIYLAARAFLEAAGLDPNTDAVEQLVVGFLPSLQIICERDHAEDGSTWKRAGTKPQLHELFKKADRLNYRAWRRDIPDIDSARDIINYAGFYLRALVEELPAWGEWGEPGPWRSNKAPEIVCLCGSTKFADLFHKVNLQETVAGRIVLSIGSDRRSDADMAAVNELGLDWETLKTELDDLHKRKIDLADRVIVISDDSGYIGESTISEITYAYRHGVPVEFLDEAAQNKYQEWAQAHAMRR